jgi:sRNA-binding protein
LKEQYEEKEERQAQLMDVVKDLLTPPDPIQSDHARQVRYDSLQDWRRMMAQQQQQQQEHPTNAAATMNNTAATATATATAANNAPSSAGPTPRRVPTTNHFIVEAVPDLTIPVGDARVALAQ